MILIRMQLEDYCQLNFSKSFWKPWKREIGLGSQFFHLFQCCQFYDVIDTIGNTDFSWNLVHDETNFSNMVFFLQYLICEVLNFIVDVMNIYITDVFLGGRFIKYGSQVIYYYSHRPSLRRDLPNPMCTVFPTVTR